ncbi:MAG: recombinase family protein [Rhodoferax sp.]|uniref:recombinase family protein n=1 Tax=Rhodoferax sp. TaxID=50421 RepID=UPI001B57DB20|nr:recombinase family protein [Rhodoferax sp.]MBP9907731.1 recombinase family protein [Rhodoferax sp.]
MNTATQVASPKPRKRCAVYCRVSSDERLEQEFNSIDAQKEAGQSYVASQRSEGWIPVVDDYDDPGFSGGNTERPGLKRLMADIERGLVDIVVVYKIDRLTRSLADFSKMVEVFERQGVSFVSVTQQFNTTTSMGRLMLNVLLSFAQFEREVTGERIRDKIAASKRKGLWMGGMPPLGYDVANRLLVVNETEAQLVRRIFGEMLTIGSTTRIAQGLAIEGITTKSWTTQDGQVRSGTSMDKKYLFKLLRNRIYLGELSHKGSWFPGAHAAIIDHGLWGQVHEVLARNPHVRSVETQTRESTEALLRGLLFGPSGDPMYPTYASKNKRKYRYYVSKAEMRFGAAGKTHERIPAAEVEAATVNQVKTVLSSPEAITAVCKSLELQGVRINEDVVVMGLHQLGEAWEQLYWAERIRIVKLMIERVDLVAGGLKVKWHALGWKELIKEFAAKGFGAELVEMETV